MSRMISFVVLVAILLVCAALFFMVMANFFLPMFLAVLLVVMFGPLHRWFIVKCKGHDRVAAGLTTGSIVLICLVPLLLIFFQAVVECWGIYQSAATGSANDAKVSAALDEQPAADAQKPITQGQAVADAVVDRVVDSKALAQHTAKFCKRFGVVLSPESVETLIKRNLIPKLQEWLTPLMLSTTQFLGSFLLGLGVMIISLYYFLADGPWMVSAIMRLSPLNDRYEEQLVEQFDSISRAVVVATLLSAVVQGLLAGFGYYLAGLDAVFLLTMLTMLFAMVPFVGGAAIWIPACLWLLFYQERTTAAILLAVYGATIISMADNVIKPLVLQGKSNLHPLLALLSVVGGVQARGPIGILVGPMVVVFLHALLNMLQTEIDAIGNKPPQSQGMEAGN